MDNKRILGAHKSAAGGYHIAVERTAEIGGNALQIFSGSPRAWRTRTVTDEEVEAFTRAQEAHSIAYCCFHAIYLTNLADTSETGKKTVEALTAELHLASRLGIVGSVVHTGSYKKDGRSDEKFETLIQNITEVIKNTPDDSFLILENAANRKIGEKLEELGEIIRHVGSSRIRVCLDTCHLHAAGYDLRTKEKFEEFLAHVDKVIGLNKLEVIHMNDSKDEFGSLRDRHENIGEGLVGKEVFSNFLNHPLTKGLPFISETPGFDGNGPDKENMDILKSLLSSQ